MDVKEEEEEKMEKEEEEEEDSSSEMREVGDVEEGEKRRSTVHKVTKSSIKV